MQKTKTKDVGNLFEEFYKYKPLVIKLIKQSSVTYISYHDINDMIQEIYCKIWLHMADYSVEKGSIASYVAIISKSVLANAAKEFKRGKRDYTKLMSISQPVYDGLTIEDAIKDNHHPKGPSMTDIYEDKHTVEFIFNHISTIEADVMYKTFFEDKSTRTVGKEMGKSYEWVRKIIAKVCLKFDSIGQPIVV